MGFRDTLTGVEDSMLGVSEIARGNLFAGFLALGAGVGDLGSGIYNFLVPAMQSARGSMAATAVTATESAAVETASAGERAAAQTAAANTTVAATGRVRAAMGAAASFAAGPWGVAILGAAAVLGTFVAVQLQNKRRMDNFTSSLDDQTGAVTDNTRALKEAELEESKWLETAEAAGVSTRDFTDAVLGNEAAYKRVKAAIDEALSTDPATYDKERFRAAAMVNGELKRQRDALKAAREATEAHAGSTQDDTRAILENADALKEATDPAFALVKAQQRATAAQRDYDEAVKEHGATSEEARDAALALAEAQLSLRAAASRTGSTLSGPTRQALVATMRAGGATEDQIREVMKAFDAAAAAGRRFAKKYTAEIHYFYTSSGRRVEAGIVGTGVVPGRAHGGISGGGPTVINEQGPELVNLPSGSTVIPAGTTANMLAGGGQPVQVNLYVERSGDPVLDMFMNLMADRIRVRHGGNVQEALGT
jgi:hypothetical protein